MARRLAIVPLLIAVVVACGAAPSATVTDHSTAHTTATPTPNKATVTAVYLAAVAVLPETLGPDVAAYNSTCSVSVTSSACVKTLEQFGSDMDAFRGTLASLVVPSPFHAGDTALKKALADLVGSLATLITAISDGDPGAVSDSGGAVSAEAEIFPAMGIIAHEQQSTPSAAFATEDHTFSVVIPTGWSDVTSDANLLATHRLTGADLVAVQWDYLGPTDGLTVAYLSVQEVTPPLSVAGIAPYLKTVVGGVKLLTQPAAFTVDGARGLFDNTRAPSQGNEYEAQDMVVDHAGRTFEIDLTVLQSAFSQELPGFDTLMNSWRWTVA